MLHGLLSPGPDMHGLLSACPNMHGLLSACPDMHGLLSACPDMHGGHSVVCLLCPAGGICNEYSKGHTNDNTKSSTPLPR